MVIEYSCPKANCVLNTKKFTSGSDSAAFSKHSRYMFILSFGNYEQ